MSPVPGAGMPPQSLVQYVKDIRKFSLRRSFSPGSCKLPVLPRHVTLGMNVKKIHEVTNFAGYVDTLAENIAAKSGRSVTHCIDLGSGQNYLGRALASSPYSRHVIAVESKQHNITGAKTLDVKSGLAEAEKAMRNKKVYQQIMDAQTPLDKMTPKALRRIAKPIELAAGVVEAADLRPLEELKSRYIPEEGRALSITWKGGWNPGIYRTYSAKLRRKLLRGKTEKISVSWPSPSIPAQPLPFWNPFAGHEPVRPGSCHCRVLLQPYDRKAGSCHSEDAQFAANYAGLEPAGLLPNRRGETPRATLSARGCHPTTAASGSTSRPA